ncbi:uncharacterized protein LOC124125584 isoform X2 [Haliotis rufescens]|uniref:uncharacterized protein LOC124125584 isoform X2 n=1 Tax=Haliotis rufescens TaxID=6454 RepID=UPI00201F926C|nr:uncharacterized protein LOC124125584 isoform X2 [Haliotis rufescens]
MDVPLATLFLMACGFTTYIKGSNSLQLTSSPATASPGQPYTLMCSGSGGRSRAWNRRNDIIFRSRYVSDTHCAVDVSNNNLYNHLSGRINVTCSHNQYNVTLRILTSIDNGSVWQCGDDQRSQESNRWTIRVVNIMATTTTVATTATAEATTTTTATTSTTDISSSKSSQGRGSQVAYIAAGVGGGVAVVIVVVVSVLCIRRRRGRPVNNGSAHEHKHEASHTYYNENLVSQDQDINDKVQVENDIYETSRDVTSPNQPSKNDHMTTDVYAQVQKPKTNKPGPTGTADDINIEDLYAKPDKTKTRKKQED